MPQHNKPASKPLVSPLDFGAVADGVTDNSEAFQNAFDRAKKIGGRVAIPSGYFKLGKTINL